MDGQQNLTKTPLQLRIGCAIFYFISGFGYSTWASRIPTIKHQLNLNEAQLGTILFAMPIGLMLTMPVTDKLLSRYTSRAVMLFGSLWLCVIIVLIGYSNSAWQLALMLFCFGSARNLMTLSINTQGVAVQALYSKSIMAMFHGVWSLAGFAGAGVGYLMVYYSVGIHYHFLFASIALLVLTLYFIKDTIDQKPIVQSKRPVFSLPDKYLLKFSLICFASMACENAMYDWSAIYFQKAVHSEKATATAAFVVYMVAMTSGRLMGDKLVTRIGIKTVLKFSGIFIFAGLMAAVLLPFTVTAMLGFVLVGLGVSCVVPMIFSLAGKSKNMSSSSALASISTVGYTGFLLIPPFVGYIAHASSIRWSFGIIAFFGVMMVWLVSKLKTGDSHPAEESTIIQEN
ncbi:MAG: MFS transporter [Mucilaginibacter sp.]|uniref:MFS transporter n=1 Tax=Mucilaginibacter sp. L3T2-6 TaxID=3062491 RepID=UPI002674843A|nr:MFS transporter [Mucilaginibacter sp. L3T2-6]MDO3640576.1 MFS transporter [Mucilaginibacter sp. L3T2-6]MDV6213085.1 MFS transporter [Mucilaginibacter sp. L3T2-6]